MKLLYLSILMLCCFQISKGDELSPTEVEKCRKCAKFIFCGLVKNIFPSKPSKKSGNKKSLATLLVANIKITAVNKGNLKVGKLQQVYFHFSKERKPASPHLITDKRYYFYLDYKIIAGKKRLYLAEACLADKVKE